MDQMKKTVTPLLNTRKSSSVAQSFQHESFARKNMNSTTNNTASNKKLVAPRGKEQWQRNRKGNKLENAIVFKPSKNNAQDLLNFQYGPVRNSAGSSYDHHGYDGPRRKRTTTFNKETFLQANCHFVVKDSGDYTVHAVDPDLLVDWELVELIYMPTHEEVTCPICLHPPTAAKITRCGHVYCWTCILHYLHLGNHAARKCPICHESVHPNGLKSVVTCEKNKYERTKTITLTLMKRSKSALHAHPVKHWDQLNTDDDFVNWQGKFSMEEGSAGKLMLASNHNVLTHIIEHERTALEAQRVEAMLDATGEECFIDAALKIIEEKEKQLKLSCEPSQDTVQQVLQAAAEQPVCDDVASNRVVDPARVVDPVRVVEPPANEAAQVAADKRGATGAEIIAHAVFDDQPAPVAEDCAAPDDVGVVDNADEESHETPEYDAFLPYEEFTMSDDDPMWQAGGVAVSSDASDQLMASGSVPGDVSDSSNPLLAPAPGKLRSESESTDTTENSFHKVEDSNFYYFYQAEDGQHICLHPLNARCLIEEYGSLEIGPRQITGQIIDFESFTMNKVLRKRFRYLAHLPLGCEFMICELMLRPPVLSRSTVRYFMPEFKKRKAARDRKMEELRKFDRKATAANRKLNGLPTYYEPDSECYNIHLDDFEDFPSNLSTNGTPAAPGGDTTNTPLPTNWRPPTRETTPETEAQAHRWVEDDVPCIDYFPSLGQTMQPSVKQHDFSTAALKSGNQSRDSAINRSSGGGIWGAAASHTPATRNVTPASLSLRPSHHNGNNHHDNGGGESDDEAEPVPDFRDMFRSALTLSPSAPADFTAEQPANTPATTPAAAGGGGKKGKKNRGNKAGKNILFATSGQRKY